MCNLIVKSAIPILLLLSARSLLAQTIVQGNVSGTWTTAGSPYIIIATATVPSGQTLTIQPGVTVRIGLGLDLIVGGSLIAIGTATDSINFTTTEAPPAAGQWRQILINGFANLQYCVVQYGGSGSNYAILMANPSAILSIQNSTVRLNYSGLYLRGASGVTSYLTIQQQSQYGLGLANGALAANCLIANNAIDGVYCSFDSAKIENCTVISNGNGILVTGGRVQIANCVINSNIGHGIRNFGGSGSSRYLKIDSCTIALNGGDGINGGSTNLIFTLMLRRTLIYRNQGSGINFVGENSVVENNTIAYNANGIRNIYRSTAMLSNNILVSNTAMGIHTTVAPPPTVKFNDIFANTTTFSGFSSFYGDTSLGYRNKNGDKCDPFSNINFAPSFVSAGTNDYHLLATSPCRDAGDTLSQSDPDSTFADIGAFFFDRRSLTVEPVGGRPGEFVLLQNYPNPFNPSTTIEFALPKSGHAILRVYDLLGREIATLIDGNIPAGLHTTQWNPRAVSSGVYFYCLKAGGYVQTKRLLFQK